ncbi:hypothetical protein SETIT_2G251300v2 [Setaria italica]|uniref:Uncharacterized protein n=1 Tax=Setaria italica TaxID=4555 RepID=A0A368Q2E9_SETIT|nr:uncharacterized protein LOC101754006 [Setaria italica]XP_004957166.1 uncharacterized protein LOC101754006 [Setaria italica]XP_022679774.1 uncharacterized protein LOC101754006 [Setaria italica]RCV12210.1 hypothetical protein SETIT_2G251300v2 [Setaria italica]RCV12211.1 hypothetical protein SETIT_2G251300v2 [Setaria italica]
MGDHTVCLNQDESKIAAAFKTALEKIGDPHSGIVFNFYRFEYKGRDDTWYRGEIFPMTDPKSSFDKGSGNRVSIWIRAAADERRMRELVHHLLPLEDNALLKPCFAAYNSMLGKTVVSCMPCTEDFSSWISRQTQVQSDGYLHDEAKRMIWSVVSFSKVLWVNGFVSDGLDDPKNYAMMDTHVKVLPFTIRKKAITDSKMTNRNKVADLLENHLNTKWNDIDVVEFIKCLRDPILSLDVLLNHPLFLPPERRMALYVILWDVHFSPEHRDRYDAITSHANWTNLVSANDTTLMKILTYDEKNENNNICMYRNTTLQAHKFARDSCSHYFEQLRKSKKEKKRPNISPDMVDRPLKKLLPGLLSKVYALASSQDWKSV